MRPLSTRPAEVRCVVGISVSVRGPCPTEQVPGTGVSHTPVPWLMTAAGLAVTGLSMNVEKGQWSVILRKANDRCLVPVTVLMGRGTREDEGGE